MGEAKCCVTDPITQGFCQYKCIERRQRLAVKLMSFTEFNEGQLIRSYIDILY